MYLPLRGKIVYNFAVLIPLYFVFTSLVIAQGSLGEYIAMKNIANCGVNCEHNNRATSNFLSNHFDEINTYHLNQFIKASERNDDTNAVHHFNYIAMNYLSSTQTIEKVNQLYESVIPRIKNKSYEALILSQLGFLYSDLSFYNKGLELYNKAHRLVIDISNNIEDRHLRKPFITYQMLYLNNCFLDQSIFSDSDKASILEDVVCEMESIGAEKIYYYLINSLRLLLYEDLGTEKYSEYLNFFDSSKATERVQKIFQLMTLKNDAYKKQDLTALMQMVNFMKEDHFSKKFKVYYFFYVNICISIFDIGFEKLPNIEKEKILTNLQNYNDNFRLIEKIVLYPLVIDYLEINGDERANFFLDELMRVYRVDFPVRNAFSNKILHKQLLGIEQSEVELGQVERKNLWLYLWSLVAGLMLIISFLTYKQRGKTRKAIKNLNDKLSIQNSLISEQNDELFHFASLLSKKYEIILPILKKMFDDGALPILNVEDRKKKENDIKSRLSGLDKVIQSFLAFCLSKNESEETRKSISLKSCFELARYKFNNYPSIKWMGEDVIMSGSAKDWSSIFVLLIDNAIRFNEKPTQEIDIQVSLSMNALSWTIEVSDNGIGMKNKDEIFEAFYSTPTVNKEQSIGLGLNIVKNLVKNYSGNIWANTNSKNGTSVFIQLPLTPLSENKINEPQFQLNR